jgi:predicted HicB family RNase H-like nuclease
MEKDYKEKRNSFAERLKTTPAAAQIQKVEPVQTVVVEPKIEEVQINAWIPKDLMKRVKTKAVQEERSLKEVVTEALLAYVGE